MIDSIFMFKELEIWTEIQNVLDPNLIEHPRNVPGKFMIHEGPT